MGRESKTRDRPSRRAAARHRSDAGRDGGARPEADVDSLGRARFGAGAVEGDGHGPATDCEDSPGETAGGRVPVQVFPMGVSFAWVNASRSPRAELRRKYLVPPDAFVVASIGVINRLKRGQPAPAVALNTKDCPFCATSIPIKATPAIQRLGRQQATFCVPSVI